MQLGDVYNNLVALWHATSFMGASTTIAQRLYIAAKSHIRFPLSPSQTPLLLHPPTLPTMQESHLLILGAGWTSTFLIPLLRSRARSFSATTRDGREVAGAKTLKWSFDPEEDSTSGKSQFDSLPLAKYVLITFPLKGEGQSKLVMEGYKSVWTGKEVRFLQLGSTGIWQIEQTSHWVDRQSPYNTENTRAVAEDELLELGGCVLNLAGLWGGPRQPRDWVSRVAKTKEDVRGKKSLHMIHGQDVARSILAVTEHWDRAEGERWMLTDGFVYDWWSLFAGWADEEQQKEGSDRDGDVDPEPLDQARWVYELMAEDDVKALPRSMETLGRCYDSREFWSTFKLAPLRGRMK